ncbi:MAG: hypothetical protein U0939_20675 [Pirellulales bacterium]
MTMFARHITRFLREEDAPTMVEYAILVAAVSVLVGMSAHLLSHVCAEMFKDASVVATIP